MKPDDFDDSVRRKLDGIDPPFREKDWTQMQQVMRQHGMITPWSTVPSWVLPTAGVVSVAAMLTATVWLGHTNEQLRDDVERLNKTVTQLKQTPPAAPQRTDTVYVTRFVPTPSNNQTNTPSIEPNLSVPNVTPTRDNAVATQSQTDASANRSIQTGPIQAGPDSVQREPLERIAAERKPDRRSDVSVTPDRVVNQSSVPDPERTGQPTTLPNEPGRGNVNPNRPNVGTAPTNAAGNRVVRETGINRSRTRTGDDRVAQDQDNVNRSAENGERTRTNTSPTASGQTGAITSAGSRSGSRPNGTPSAGTPNGQTESNAPVVIERIAAKPIRIDSVEFNEGISISRAVRRLRRLYPAKDLLVVPTTAPENTAVVTPNERFRLGVAAEMGLKEWSLGLYGDVLLGRHFLIGLGLERVNISGGEFLTDGKYNTRTKRDFRRDYAQSIDYKYDILNINRRSITWQVPITLGYRVPLGYGMALTPIASISTSLTAREIISFTYRRAPGDFSETQYSARRPVNWYHSWSASLGVEKRLGPLTVQASPYLVGPFTDSPLGLSGTSGGIRLRTLYSF